MDRQKENSLTPRTWLLPILLLMLIAFGLRVYHLDFQSIWGDEALSIVRFKDMAVADLVTEYHAFSKDSGDSHPPLYYVLQGVWRNALGDTVFAHRFLSVLFSVLAVPLLFLVGRELSSARDGFAAALFCTFSAFHIWYAQEARMYALTAFLCLVATLAFLRLMKGFHLPNAVLYVAGSLLLIYTHYFGLILLMLQNLFFLFSRRKQLSYKKWFLLQGILFILYLPWIPFLLQALFVKTAEAGLPRYFSPLFSLPFIFIKYSMFGNETYIRNHIFVYLLGGVVFALAFASGLVVSLRKQRPSLWFLLLFTFVPVFFVYLAPYLLSENVYSVHSLLMFTFFFYLIITRGAFNRGNSAGLFLFILMVALNIHTLIQLNYGKDYQKPRMKETVAYIVEKNDRDAVTGKLPIKLPGAGSLSYYPFKYYAGDRIRETPLTGETVDDILEKIRTFERSADRFWLLVHEHVLAEKTNRGVVEGCKEHYPLLEVKRFDSRMRNSNLVLYCFSFGKEA